MVEREIEDEQGGVKERKSMNIVIGKHRGGR